MRPTRHRTLGIALQEKGLLVVEARPAGGGTAMHAAARMQTSGSALPAGAAGLAGPLRDFLHEQGLHARRAVIGVPARWLVCREMTVPSVDQAQLAGLLRIRAEREIASDVGKLAADYARTNGANVQGPVLLVAMLQEHLDQIKTMAQEAGLKLEAVLPTVMVLAAAAPAPGCHVVLDLREDGTDVALLTDGQFRVLRDVPRTDAEGIASAIRRMLAPLGSPSGRVTVWGEGSEALAAALATRVGMEVGAGVGVPTVEGDGPGGPQAFTGAVALALADSNMAARPVDFAHSRLAEVHAFHLGRRAFWALALALTVLIAAGMTVWDWRRNQSEVQQLQGQLKLLAPQIATAQQMVDRVTQARGWYDRRPPFLECLRALARAFPLDGRIWASSLRVQEDMRCVVTGKSSDDGLILQLLDALKGSGKFEEVKLLYVNTGQAADRTSSFAISFTFVGSE